MNPGTKPETPTEGAVKAAFAMVEYYAGTLSYKESVPLMRPHHGTNETPARAAARILASHARAKEAGAGALAASWRTLANNCESEIARSNDPQSSFHMSRYAVTLHEQSAIIYRKCADELASEALAKQEGAHHGTA